jgi:hypothetical protein
MALEIRAHRLQHAADAARLRLARLWHPDPG